MILMTLAILARTTNPPNTAFADALSVRKKNARQRRSFPGGMDFALKSQHQGRAGLCHKHENYAKARF